MKIARVTATPLNVPLHIKLVGLDHKTTLACCLVDVETDTGIVGTGLTSITEEDVIAQIVNGVAGPAILGDDPLLHERIWDKLYWTMMPRGQTGYAAHALAAIDVALWGIKGKALGQPVWRLLGGARDRAPVYATFGYGFFGRDQLAAAAKLWVGQGFKRIKMTVGDGALRNRDKRPLMEVIREDAARVQAVREAVGPDIEIYIDGNCNLDLYHATKLIEMIKPLGISFFEEPLTQNDALQMRELRRATGMALACGQNEGLAFRFRDLLLHEAVDFVQPNVASPAASRNAFALRAWLRHSTCRWRTAAPGASTTCICRPASRTARWSSTIILRSSSTSRSIAICRCRRMGTSRCRTRRGSASSPTATPSARSRSCRCRKGRGRASAGGNARGAGRSRTAAACRTCGGS